MRITCLKVVTPWQFAMVDQWRTFKWWLYMPIVRGFSMRLGDDKNGWKLFGLMIFWDEGFRHPGRAVRRAVRWWNRDNHPMICGSLPWSISDNHCHDLLWLAALWRHSTYDYGQSITNSFTKCFMGFPLVCYEASWGCVSSKGWSHNQ